MTDELSPKQVNAASLLICGMKAVGVAQELGISPQTLSRWQGEPAFKAAMNRCKWEILSNARQRLQLAAESAVDCLVEIATDSQNEESRRRASMDIIRLVGLADPSKGLYGWGIGPNTAQEVVEEELQEQYLRQLSTPDFIFEYRKRKSSENKEDESN